MYEPNSALGLWLSAKFQLSKNSKFSWLYIKEGLWDIYSGYGLNVEYFEKSGLPKNYDFKELVLGNLS